MRSIWTGNCCKTAGYWLDFYQWNEPRDVALSKEVYHCLGDKN
jgi:hypothetical protein